MRKIVTLAVIFSAVCIGVMFSQSTAFASDVTTQSGQTEYVSVDITNDAGTQLSSLQDGNTSSGVEFAEGETFTILPQSSAEAVYITWDRYPQSGYSISQNDTQIEQNSGFFQDYALIPAEGGVPVTIQMNSAGKATEIRMISSADEVPEDVHVWQNPAERADILILTTHADDEHLFFGGVMPTYVDRGGITIQVAYMVNHSTEPYRQQELLNGLWEAGVRNYPIIPQFPDIFSDSLEHAKTIYDEQEIINYVVGLLEQFAPKVVVGHDLNGEYGHGAHMLYAESLLKAVEISQAQPQKVYLHLYAENEIVMEVDTPLEHFEGRTSFEVAEDAFAHHRSQQTYFSVEKDGPYDLRKFGLAFSLTQPDTGNDMMENITTYAQEEQIAAEEEAQRLEEEQEAQRLAEEAAKKAEEEKAAQEMEAQQNAANTHNLYVLVLCAVILIAVVGIVILAIYMKRKK